MAKTSANHAPNSRGGVAAPPRAFPFSASSQDVAVIWDAGSEQWLAFEHPRQVIRASSPEEVMPALQAAEQSVAHGETAAGWIAYEAAPACDSALSTRPPGRIPLLWFGLYRDPRILEPDTGDEEYAGKEPSRILSEHGDSTADRAAYATSFEHIKSHIQNGDAYQINLTHRLRGHAETSQTWSLFRRLVKAQGRCLGAFVLTKDWILCSASPELFFRLDGTRIVSRPMKGTAARALTQAEDLAQAAQLATSPKNRAENLMIVDMVRNDLGRIADTASVSVPALFTVEKYPTLWQMTSTVTAETRAALPDIFRALFPPASITGAPKCSAMRIIAEEETTPRGVYTGAVGFLCPGRRAQFNVAIRTLTVERDTGNAEYGVGGGIVWDSDCELERQECRIKSLILTVPTPAFLLVETLRWTREEGFFLLHRHLDRMESSASYFDFAFDRNRVARALQNTAAGWAAPHKVRLTLSPGGKLSVDSEPYVPSSRVWNVKLAATPVSSGDVFLYHKTTHRAVYERAAADAADCDDVLLWNERGELTESTIANVALELDGRLCTPPIRCGLLAGTYRAELIGTGALSESVIRVDDLSRATALYLLNSVRGKIQARCGQNPAENTRA